MITESDIYENLGIIKQIFTDKIQYISYARKGVSGIIVKRAVLTLANHDILSMVLSTTPENLSNYYQLKHLNTRDSEKFLDTLSIYTEATRIFGELDTARLWLNSSLPTLAGDKPEALLDTYKGRELVRQILRKIEYGEFD